MQGSGRVVFTEAVFLRLSRFRLGNGHFFHLDRLRSCVALCHAHAPDGVVFYIFVEAADLFALLYEDFLVPLGLLGAGGIEGPDILKAVDIHVALVDEHIGDLASSSVR